MPPPPAPGRLRPGPHAGRAAQVISAASRLGPARPHQPSEARERDLGRPAARPREAALKVDVPSALGRGWGASRRGKVVSQTEDGGV